VLVGHLECAFAMFERSPPHLFLYLFYSNRKTKIEQIRALPAKTIGSLNIYFNYYLMFITIIFIYIFFIHLKLFY